MIEKKDEAHQPLRPDTTVQEDMVVAGQRKINLIWETTQSKIAYISIVSSQAINALIICAFLFKKEHTSPEVIAVITASVAAMNLTVGIIIGFYFSRTNHSAIGGIGKKEIQSTVGTR